MHNMADLLIEQSIQKESVLVVGLDPDISFFPSFLLQDQEQTFSSDECIAEAIFDFNKIVMDAVYEQVVAVKPQLAYYEIYGSQGILALEKTIAYARSKGLLVINDAKRGDIGSTSAAYAKAHLGNGAMAGDMVTVNPFLGSDGYLPFIELSKTNDKGIFILLKTSNASSHEIQNLQLESGALLYENLARALNLLAEQTKGKHGYSFIGAVVGATYAGEAEIIRTLLPHSLFLVPGFGMQGGKAEDLRVFFDAYGNGAVISSSRGITYCYANSLPKEQWSKITESEMSRQINQAVTQANQQINQARFTKTT